MKYKTFSYRYAQEIFEHPKYKKIYDEIVNIVLNCPLPIYKDKSPSQPKLDVVQQIINTYFKLAFNELTWEAEAAASPDEFEDSLRSDFRKVFKVNNEEISIQIEVEMGNSASTYRNYFKFQLSFSYGLTDICVIIVPCQSLCTRIDTGVANFEKVVREIPSAKLSITVPTLVIGLDNKDDDGIDVKLFCTDLEIVKGSKKKYEKEHIELVKKITACTKYRC